MSPHVAAAARQVDPGSRVEGRASHDSFSTQRYVTTHAQGDDDHGCFLLAAFQCCLNTSMSLLNGIPSAATSLPVMSCNCATLTSAISSLRREAQRGIVADDLHFFP